MGQLQTMMCELMLRDRGIPGTVPYPTTQQHSVRHTHITLHVCHYLVPVQ